MSALSLVCKQCGTQLRSVAEAQNHGEATGHSQFEESTAKVATLVCTACGKPCRTPQEQDMHTKHNPGHDSFVDKTEESNKAINTEVEMKDASAAMAEEAAAEAGVALPEVKPKAAAMEAADQGAGSPPELVPATVNSELRQQLEDMGFSPNKATRALHFSGNNNLEGAVEWLSEHSDDPDCDEPLLVPHVEAKAPLSNTEARKQAEDLFRKAKEKREKEEKELERLREQERIRMGKEMALVRRQEEEQKLKQNMEARKREKAEEAKARERIRVKLDEDRRARRRKLGLPEELSEEEKAAEAAKLAEKDKARTTAAKAFVTTKPVTLLATLRLQLVEMKKTYGTAEDARLKTCWQTLLKYLGNVARDPAEEKYRRIKLSNAAFQQRVGSLTGAITIMETLGFKKEADGESLHMPREQVDIEALNAAGNEINNAITNPFFGAL